MTLPSRMRAAQITKYGQPYELTELPVPSISPSQILIRIHAASLCHSDIQVLNGQFSSKLPMIPSHEPAGTIAALGSDVDTSTWKVGDRVGVLNFRGSCKECTGCGLAERRYGGLDPRFCEKRETAGFQHDGAFADYLVADPATTVKLPDSLDFEQAAPLMCAGATVWGALEKATENLEPNAAVAIVGIGGLGHLGLQFAKSQGFRTVALDARDPGLDLASSIPAPLTPDVVLNSSAPDTASAIQRFTNGEGLAAAIVCTDDLDVNAWALEQLGIGGVLVALGLPPEKWRFDSSAMVFKELTIKGSYVASAESTRRMMKAVGEAGVSSHLTVVGFDDIPKLVDMYNNHDFKGRLVVKIV